MKPLMPSFSHINLELKKQKPLPKNWGKPLPLDEILRSSPKIVSTYDELVTNVAQILYYNRHLTLYYRGQSGDFKEDNKTTIFPSIYRKKAATKALNLKERFELLYKKVDELKVRLKEQKVQFTGTLMINRYPEIAWSLLQHYEVSPTPLLDLTQSLHVACSFACHDNKNKTGIIYVLGMPWVTDAIGYNPNEELVNVRLLGVCPPSAQRPFFQEGYLAGPFPNYELDNTKRIKQFDFARRLIAKFEIPANTGDFWGTGFDIIPKLKLYPEKDEIKEICEKLK